VTDDEPTDAWEAASPFPGGIGHHDHLRIAWVLPPASSGVSPLRPRFRDQPGPGRLAYRRLKAYPITKTTTPQSSAPPSAKPAEAPVAREITTQISAEMPADRRLLQIIVHTLPRPTRDQTGGSSADWTPG
jgi:hypothetical protein